MNDFDDVVAESGWSLRVVYRYVRSKEELHAGSADETSATNTNVVEDLLARDPVPTLRELIHGVVDVLDDAKNGRNYSLAARVIQTWSEALRMPIMDEQSRLAVGDG